MIDSQKSHSERVALLRPIPYEMIAAAEDPATSIQSGKALSEHQQWGDVGLDGSGSGG
jgi:hypothetical protein